MSSTSFWKEYSKSVERVQKFADVQLLTLKLPGLSNTCCTYTGLNSLFKTELKKKLKILLGRNNFVSKTWTKSA